MGCAMEVDLDQAMFCHTNELSDNLLKFNAELNDYLSERGYNVKSDIESLVVSPVHYVIDIGDQHTLYHLLMRKAPVHMRNVEGDTPIHLVAKTKLRHLIYLLLFFLRDDEIDNTINKDGLSHLHVACMRNDPRFVERLLLKGADVNACVNDNSPDWAGNSPLHFAVYYNCARNVEVLLAHGADIRIKNDRGLTALHVAEIYGNKRIIKLILEANASIKENPDDGFGFSHFHIACMQDNSEYARAFIARGKIDVNAVLSHNAPMWKGCTALHLAAKFHRSAIVELLLKNEADPNAKDSKGATPLHLACLMDGDKEYEIFENMRRSYRLNDYKPWQIVEYFYSYDEHIKIAHLLLSHKCNVNALDRNLRSPLMFAYSKDATITKVESENSFPHAEQLMKWLDKKRKRLMRILLEHGADPNVTDAHGYTLLHMIAGQSALNYTFQDPAIMDMLIRFGARVNSTRPDDRTALHMAVRKERAKLVHVLLSHEADANYPASSNEICPIHCTIDHQSNQILMMLLDQGADPNSRTKSGDTLLHQAIKAQSVKVRIVPKRVKREVFDLANGDVVCFAEYELGIFNCLLDYGVDMNKCDVYHVSPLQTACMNKDTGKVRFLLDNGADLNVRDALDCTPLMHVYNENTLYTEPEYAEVDFDQLFYLTKRHVKMMMTLGAFTCDHNVTYVDMMDELYLAKFCRYDMEEYAFLQECNREVARMRSFVLANDGTTLCDVFKRSHEDLAELVDENDAFARTIKHPMFEAQFGIYGRFLKQQFKKGCLYKLAFDGSKDSFMSEF